MPGASEGLLDEKTVRSVAGGCGWSVPEFADFYAPRAWEELAEIEDAYARGDTATVLRLTHGAGGSSATAGMVALTVQYQRVEAQARDEPDTPLEPLLAETRALLETVLAALRAFGATE